MQVRKHGDGRCAENATIVQNRPSEAFKNIAAMNIEALSALADIAEISLISVLRRLLWCGEASISPLSSNAECHPRDIFQYIRRILLRKLITLAALYSYICYMATFILIYILK